MDRVERKLSSEQRRRLETSLQGINPLQTSAFVEACKADLEQGDVVLLDGEIVFDPKAITAVKTDTTYGSRGQRLLTACMGAYSARISGREPAGLAPGVAVLPGTYRVHLAPRANLVVGVDELVGPNDHAQQMRRILFDAQGITEETLRENRRGRMTEAQRQTLRAMPKSYAGYGFAILGLICALATYVSVTSALDKNKSLWSAPIVMGTCLTVLSFAFLPSMLVEQRKMGRDTQIDADEGRVVARDDVARKRHTMHRSLISLKLALGEQEFDMTDKPELFAAVVEGQTYRAWVAPRSGRLIALEFPHENDKG